MPEKNNIQDFLGRMESSANEYNRTWESMDARQQLHLAHYKKWKNWPGSAYMYVGYSENLDNKILGTEQRLKRNTCVDLLFEAKGNAHNCVRLDVAMNFEGFAETLSRFEKDLLCRLPAETLLGPSYDCNGSRVPGAFTIWRELHSEEASLSAAH